MPTRLRSIALVALAVMSLTPATPVAAQATRTRAPDVVSPEVHADRRVTFRLHAPKADTVRLTGEIMDGREPVALIRRDSGVWNITVGPMTPDIYTYAFDVDGVRVPDPLNGYV
jgi:enterochelin esterase family protein